MWIWYRVALPQVTCFKPSDAEVGEEENKQKQKMERTLEALRQVTYLSKSVNAVKPVL